MCVYVLIWRNKALVLVLVWFYCFRCSVLQMSCCADELLVKFYFLVSVASTAFWLIWLCQYEPI